MKEQSTEGEVGNKPGRRPPPRFTGRWGELYWYKGQPWFGPSNMIGCRKRGKRLVVIEGAPGIHGLAPSG